MRVFQIRESFDSDAAVFYVERSEEAYGPDCPQHGRRTTRVFPAVLYYGGGKRRDFTSSLEMPMIAASNIVEDLIQRFGGIDPQALLILCSPHAGAYECRKVAGAHPYKGPPLYELWVARDVPADLSGRSTLNIIDPCPICGTGPFYEILGMEEEVKGPPRGQEVYTWIRQARNPEQGIFVPRSQLERDSFFTYVGWGNFCTEEAKQYIEEKGWTGIEFWECGTVVDG